MSKTIENLPEYLTRDQYTDLIRSVGLEPTRLYDLRFARDGVHALVGAVFPDGSLRIDPSIDGGGYYKHRIFIPVRDEDGDTRTTRVKAAVGKPPLGDPRTVKNAQVDL